MAGSQKQSKFEEAQRLLEAEIQASKDELLEDHSHEYDRWGEFCQWLSEISEKGGIAVYWAEGGVTDNALSLWADYKADNDNRIYVNLPSDCSPGELDYQILVAACNQIVGVDLLRIVSLPRSREREVSQNRQRGIDSFPYPKEVSERRALLERVSGYYNLHEVNIFLEGAENLTPKALKELIYLSKECGFAFFLLGNEELPELAETARSNRIDVYREPGRDLNQGFSPEFLKVLERYYSARTEHTDNLRREQAAKKEKQERKQEMKNFTPLEVW